MQRGEDGVERRVVNIRQADGAIELVGEPIERGLLIGAPRQHGFVAFARSDVASDFRRAKMTPCASLTGDTLSDTWRRLLSLRCRMVS